MATSFFGSVVWKLTSRTATLAVGGGTGFTVYKYETDEGFRRSMEAYRFFVPVILHYRFLEAQQRWLGSDRVTEDDWLALDERYAASTVAKLGELQGMYTKYGQTAAGFTNTLGDKWIVELRKLEDQVPPRSVESVKQTIQQETNGQMDEIFEHIDPVPLGSASIGQVHRAVLRVNSVTNGKGALDIPPIEVAVKVQYPEAQTLFRGDMATIRSLCEVLAPEQIVMLNALEKQNAHELEYKTEARNLVQVRQNMIQHGFQPREVVVPAPIPQLTTSRMLVMELLPGIKLMDGIHAYYHKWAVKNGTTLWELQQEARQRIERDGIPVRYNGPSAWQVGQYRMFLEVCDGIANTGIAIYNGTLGWILPRSMLLHYRQTCLPPNTPRIVDTLMRVHGYQLFSDGLFNAGKFQPTI